MHSRRDRHARRLRHLAALVIAAAFCLPLYWVLIASLRQPGLPPPRTVEWWPQSAHWGNYAQIFRTLPMAQYIWNSLIVVSIAVPITLLIASWGGFGLAQLPDLPRRRLYVASVAMLMIPGSSVWILRFQILGLLGLLDSLWALIVPALAAGSPLFVLLFHWAFRRIPAEVFEAARIEGASAWDVWWRLALPLARPTVVAVSVLAFVMYWSDFVSPVLYIYRPSLYTLPVGLQILKQMDATNWPLLMAAAAVMALPVVLLFGLAQRHFLHDLALANVLEKD
jgi:multiple sugar transport system permease protein